jgi:hypothetical protein
MQVTVNSISLYAQQKIAAELLKQGTKHQLHEKLCWQLCNNFSVTGVIQHF